MFDVTTYARLVRILQCVGWGPTDGMPMGIAFCREADGSGWRVGDGIIVAPWVGREVPEDKMQALYEMELFYNELHVRALGQPLVPELELLSRASELVDD